MIERLEIMNLDGPKLFTSNIAADQSEYQMIDHVHAAYEWCDQWGRHTGNVVRSERGTTSRNTPIVRSSVYIFKSVNSIIFNCLYFATNESSSPLLFAGLFFFCSGHSWVQPCLFGAFCLSNNSHSIAYAVSEHFKWPDIKQELNKTCGIQLLISFYSFKPNMLAPTF